MLAAVAVLEIAARIPRFKNAAASAGYILVLSAPLAVVAAICGWLLSLGGGYDEKLLSWHKWLGTGTAVASVLTAIFYYWGKIIIYRANLFTTVGLVMVAGHLGGSLTHGSNYLTDHAPRPLMKLLGLTATPKTSTAVSPEDLKQLPVFTGLIEPVLEHKCVRCHGPDKSKAALRLDSFAALEQGSENGPVISPGNAADSPLMKRALLPADNADHMPPAGKPQLTTAEITLLKWWIDAGAPETNRVGQLQPPPEVFAPAAN